MTFLTAKRIYSPQTIARLAGVLYLIIIVCGLSAEVFVRGALFDAADAAKTAANIAESSALFRAGLVLDVFMLFADIALAVLLFVLFKPVSKTLSLLAAAFRFAQASILGMNLLNYYAAFLVLSGASFSAIESAEKESLAHFFLTLHSYGYDVGLLFFGVSTFLIGFLIIRSQIFPKALGVALLAAALVYLLGSFTRFLAPDMLSFIQPLYVITIVAESWFCLYLLFKGVQRDAATE